MTSSFPPPPAPGDDGARPEFLDSGSGASYPPPPPPYPPGGAPRRRSRKGLIAGGTAIGLVAAAGGAFAVYQIAFATGPQPAEALPASTVGYVGVDLDPSGEQKLEALDALEKFPFFRDHVDVDSDDDLRRKVVELIQDEEGVCPDLDFGDDIDPWLGDRFGFAAVDVGEEVAGNEEGVAPVLVVQVTDTDGADDGIGALKACLSGTGESSRDSGDVAGGWAVEGDWAVIAGTTEIAEAVSDAAQDDPLSDDDDFRRWTEAAGDHGIITAYASPEAGPLLVEGIDVVGPRRADCLAEPMPSEPSDDAPSDYDDSYDSCDDLSGGYDAGYGGVRSMLEGFEGGALTVRFNDGGIELETASSMDLLGLDGVAGSDRGDDVVASLPDDTAIALGVGFEDGWFTGLTDYLEDVSGGMLDLDAELSRIEQETGLTLPDDAETLAGESAAVAIRGDVDWEALESGPADQPIGVKVQGDADAITEIADQLLGDPDVAREVGDAVVVDSDDDHAVASLSQDWADDLLEGGNLGDSEAYRDVVPESDRASQVLFVNFNEGEWLERAVAADGGDPEVLENLEPLKALGLSSWVEDDVSHSLLRVTVD